MSETSLGELLRHEEDSAVGAEPVSGIRWWLRSLFVAVGLTALTVFGLRLYGIGVSVVAVLTAVLTLLLLRRVTAQLAPPQLSRQLVVATEADYRVNEPDGVRSEVSRWERRLQWSHGELERFVRTMRPLLADLVDERLRQQHGITRASDPMRARAMLGEPLWALLHGRVYRTPIRREFAEILAKLESL
jgi:hypothetical protein